MRKYSFRFIGMVFVLALCFSFSYSNLSRADACLPSCSSTDARFLVFSGEDLLTLIQPGLNFGIGSSAGSPQLNFGLFDADAGATWDEGAGMGIEINLYADPLGDGSGNIPVGQWFSDGSGGLNMGNPMPDNGWFDITIFNVTEAMAESGNYLYRLEVVNRDPDVAGVLNSFKLRTDDSLVIFPEQPFAFLSSLFGDTILDFITAVNIVYPNFDFGAPGCIPPDYCDYTDPACCLFGTTYDGLFDIFVLFEEGSTLLDFWDGDADYGRIIPADGPPYEDTDDPNTPGAPFLPPWANPATANFQASVGAFPPDDQFFGIFRRSPNVTYNLISPDGNSYHNDNPSGTEEWELFQLNTEPGCAPFICDIEVNSVPGGIWIANFVGLDMDNSVFLRLEGIVLGTDDNNEPVLPLEPDAPPVNVPTFSEWGMLAVVFFLGIIGFYHLRRKKNLQKI